MTIPEGAAGGPDGSKASDDPEPRVVRPTPKRTAPNRSRPVDEDRAGANTAYPASKAKRVGDAPHDPTISEAVAHAVKTGYDVIAENIKQGRMAAQRFRQGEYNIREAPGDLEIAALRLIQLARELSTTTLDVCERLLKEVGANAPGKDHTAEVPPFRATVNKAPPPPAKAPGDPSMNLTIRFVGPSNARAHTATLSRPRRPTAPSEITVAPLASRDAATAQIGSVKFEVDMAVEGLVATVPIPAGQPPGFYSGLVYAGGDEAPLGVLTIEILK